MYEEGNLTHLLELKDAQNASGTNEQDILYSSISLLLWNKTQFFT